MLVNRSKLLHCGASTYTALALGGLDLFLDRKDIEIWVHVSSSADSQQAIADACWVRIWN